MAGAEGFAPSPEYKVKCHIYVYIHVVEPLSTCNTSQLPSLPPGVCDLHGRLQGNGRLSSGWAESGGEGPPDGGQHHQAVSGTRHFLSAAASERWASTIAVCPQDKANDGADAVGRLQRRQHPGPRSRRRVRRQRSRWGNVTSRFVATYCFPRSAVSRMR